MDRKVQQDGLDGVIINIYIGGTEGQRENISSALSASQNMDQMSKKEAKYRVSDSPKVKCGTCEMFDNGVCDLVIGKIDETYVCDYWEKG